MLLITLQLALRELRANLMRSILTTLGIVVGVGAVVIVVTLGQGLTQQVTSGIAAMGRNLIMVMPSAPQRGGPGAAQLPFKMSDAEAIRREISGIAAVAPTSSASVEVVYGSNSRAVSITGTTSDFLTIRDWPVAQGRAFTDSDLNGARVVCLLGATPKKELFGAQNPIGAAIRVKNASCDVIGVLATKGQSTMGPDQDDTILMPILAVQRRLTGSDDVSQILVSAVNAAQIQPVKQRLTVLMRERRHIKASGEDNFDVRDVASITDLVNSTATLLTLGLSAVAAVSLLVGGIGIMNIMLVSVTERTREIGIRLAVGALESDVLLQFLIEAVLLSCFGGILGALFGLGFSAVAAYAIGVPFVLSPWVIVVAFGFSAAVGVVFGFFPARRAARLDPIEALRYE
ncbi:MAG: ABC transporter permease [Alphaproteobacteria bacterium]|nr:ABC transporter permease [Alphaproteobacteria bacterium]